jgi:Golgi phosphoprotein 3
MASTGGLSRRRGAGASDSANNSSSSGPLPGGNRRNSTDGKIASDPRDVQMEDENKTQPKLTLMEEILLLGLKDKQVQPFSTLVLMVLYNIVLPREEPLTLWLSRLA